MIFKAMRLHQWVKNLFVIIPLLFSLEITSLAVAGISSLIAFISFCTVSSAIYLINDLCDLQQDQKHPAKRNRPIASGALGYNEATALIMLLILSSLALAYILDLWFMAVIVIYAAINIVYSLGLKNFVILDVIIISAGFVLRIAGGGIAVKVAPSHWMILCTVTVLCFLGFTKRRAELNIFNKATQNTRQVLKNYKACFLDKLITMSAILVIFCYLMYAIDTQVTKTRAMLLTLPLVIYGVLRYIYIIYNLHGGQDPAITICHDKPMVINLTIWLLTSVTIANYGDKIMNIAATSLILSGGTMLNTLR